MAFWKKRKKPETRSDLSSTVLAYLTVPIGIAKKDFGNPAVCLSVQIFLLGVVDQLAQRQLLTGEQFTGRYAEVLTAINLLPNESVEEFVRKVEHAVSENQEKVSKLMRVGAQSIRMFLDEKDAHAPSDLLQAVAFGKMHADDLRI